MVGQTLHLAGFADIPILAKATAQIATRCAKGKNRSPRIKVIQGLFFDGIDAKPAALAVRGEHHGVVDVLAYKTKASLIWADFAEARAQVTLQSTIVQAMPKTPWVGSFLHDSPPLLFESC